MATLRKIKKSSQMSMKRAVKIDSGTASPKQVATQRKYTKAKTRAILARKPGSSSSTQAILKKANAAVAGSKGMVAAARRSSSLINKRSGPASSPIAKKK